MEKHIENNLESSGPIPCLHYMEKNSSPKKHACSSETVEDWGDFEIWILQTVQEQKTTTLLHHLRDQITVIPQSNFTCIFRFYFSFIIPSYPPLQSSIFLCVCACVVAMDNQTPWTYSFARIQV